MTITKKKLSRKISRKLDISSKDSSVLVNLFFKTLADNHKRDISIGNFGTFSLKKTPQRLGRNPKTLEEFPIKARMKLKFKPSEEIKKIIN